MLDLEVWIAILDFVNSKADEEFWKLVENIGYEMGVEFKLRNLGLKDYLQHLEFKNILSFSEEEGIYILTLVSRSATNLVLHLLKGAIAAMQLDVEMIAGVRKIVIVDKKSVRGELQKLLELGKAFENTKWPLW